MLKSTNSIFKSAALLFALCLTSGAWAAAGDSVTFANDGHSFTWTHQDFTDSNSYTITIPVGGSLSASDYVRVNSFAFGRNSVNDAVNVASVTSVDFAGNTISSASYATDNKFPAVAAWKEKYSFGAAGSANDLILKVGETYDFALLNSSGSTPTQHLGVYTTTDGAYSPVAQTVTDASTKRMQQEVVVTVLASAVTSAGGNWSALSWSNAPAEWTAATTAPVLVIVTESCSVALDAAVSVDSIIFDIAPGKTLTLTGANTITAANGIFLKGGTLVVANEGTLSGTIKVQNDAGITISGNSDTAGSVSIDVADGATLNLSASSLTSVDTINLTGSGAVVPQTTIAAKVDIGAGVTVSANSGATIRVSNFKGAGTIVFDGVLPSNANAASSTVTASATDSSTWTGTLWLKNYNTTQTSTGLYVSYWCNTNSKLKFTNVSGYLPTNGYLGYNGSELGEWILEDEVVDAVTKYAFTKTDGFSGYWVRFKKLSGSGTMAEKSGKTQTPQVRIADGSEFTGTLKLDQGMRVAFSDDDVSISAKQIVIASGEEVTANSAWTTDGFVVDGTLNLNATPSGKVVSGSGTVNLGSLSVANGITDFASAAAWTGKVVVPAFTSSGTTEINCNNLGSQSSTLIFKGITRNSWDGIYVQPICGTVNPTIQLDGNVELTNGNASPTYFSKVTGTGNLSFRGVWQGATLSWKINTLSGYTGTLTADNATASSLNLSLSIGTLALDSTPSISDRLVNINSNAQLANIVNVADIAVTVGGEATEYKLIKKNVGTATAGLYLAPAVIKDKSGNLTPYETVQAAFTALEGMDYSTFDYIAVYETATVHYYSMNPPKTKAIGEDIILTVNFPEDYGDYWWTPIAVSGDGVASYNWGAKPTTYTWVGDEEANWSETTSWKYDATHNATRELVSTDTAVFEDNATVTMDKNGTVAGIVISADVVLNAESEKTLTIGDDGIDLAVVGASLTVSENVTLSKVPTTSVENYAVQTTVVDGTTTYTAVPAVAQVDDVGYATMAEAEEALKTGTILRLLDDYESEITLYPGTYLVLNGHTVPSNLVVGADTDGNKDDAIIVNYYSQGGYYQCIDCRTDSWQGVSAYWAVLGNWSGGFVPIAATAVTIPATDGHTTAITLTADVSIKSLTLGAGETLTLSAASAKTLTTTSAIVLTSGQSIVTGSNVTISPAITTSDAHSYIASNTDGSGNTTYTVAVYAASVTDSSSNVTDYATVAAAVSAAATGDAVSLNADSSEAITLNDKAINFSEGSYTFSGTFTGNGTVVLGAALKSANSDRWPVGWTGTVELKGITSVIADFNFAHYGNANSTVKANDVLIRLNPEATETDVGGVGVIEVASGGLKFGGTKVVDKIFYISATITGSGTISVGTPGGETDDTAHKASCTKYVFSGDYSAFRGAVNFSGASSFRAGIVFSNGSDTIPTQTDWGQIIVTENATLTTSGTLDGAGGFIIEGEIDLLSGGSVTTGGAKIGGDGLIVLTEGSSGALASSKFNSTKWTGVVELKDITTVINNFNFANYGTANSTVKMNNVDIHMPSTGGAYGNVGTIEVADGDLRFAKSNNTADSIAGQTFTFAAAITGTGKIRVGTRCQTDNSAMSFYIFTGDLSDFTGGVDFNETGYYKPTIVFKTPSDAMPDRNTDEWGQILVSENTVLNVSKPVVAPAGLVLKGTINVLNGGSISVDSPSGKQINGDGRITYATPLTEALKFNNSWSGTVVLPQITDVGNNGFYFNWYGKAGSTIEIANGFTGWLNAGSDDTRNVKANVVIPENKSLVITGTNGSTTYGFAKVSGAGNLTIHQTNQPTSITIGLVEDYTGELTTDDNDGGTPTAITVNKVKLDSAPAAGDKLVATSTPDYVNIATGDGQGVYVGDTKQVNVNTVKKVDGIYVGATAATTGEGAGAVTTVTTDSSTTSVTVDLGGTYSGKVDLPGNITALTVTGGATVNANQLRLVTTQGTYAGILALSGTAVSLDGTKSVTFNEGTEDEETVNVTPAVASSAPMTMPGATTAPSFSIKTIPGLYYVVRSGTSPSLLTAGDATQATTTTTGLAGPALGNEDTVRYYKISVGRTAAEAAEAAQ